MDKFSVMSDCDGAPFWVPPYSDLDSSPVAYDINGNGVTGDTLPPVPAEWPRLKLGNGRIGP